MTEAGARDAPRLPHWVGPLAIGAVLTVVRPIRSTGWGLVVKIDRDEALGAARTDARQQFGPWSHLGLQG